MLVVTAFIVLLGCVSLALSQKRNWKLVTGSVNTENNMRAARTAGWLLLAIGLIGSVVIEGVGFGALIWPLFIALASFLAAMLLSFRPTFLRPIARIYQSFS